MQIWLDSADSMTKELNKDGRIHLSPEGNITANVQIQHIGKNDNFLMLHGILSVYIDGTYFVSFPIHLHTRSFSGMTIQNFRDKIVAELSDEGAIGTCFMYVNPDFNIGLFAKTGEGDYINTIEILNKIEHVLNLCGINPVRLWTGMLTPIGVITRGHSKSIENFRIPPNVMKVIEYIREKSPSHFFDGYEGFAFKSPNGFKAYFVEHADGSFSSVLDDHPFTKRMKLVWKLTD